MNEVLDYTYLLFTEEQVLNHFAMVKHRGDCITNEAHLSYYKNSIKQYHQYLADNPDRITCSSIAYTNKITLFPFLFTENSIPFMQAKNII